MVLSKPPSITETKSVNREKETSGQDRGNGSRKREEEEFSKKRVSSSCIFCFALSHVRFFPLGLHNNEHSFAQTSIVDMELNTKTRSNFNLLLRLHL